MPNPVSIMKNIARGLFASVFICWASLALGWSGEGHEAIAKAAFQELTPAQKKSYKNLLQGNRISKPGYPIASQIGYLARWPDHIRDQSLARLFKRHGSGAVPKSLARYAQKNTNNWHYENTLYLQQSGRVVDAAARSAKSGACPPARNGELLRVWPLLLKAYKQSQNAQDKTLLLSLLLHFAGDAHQPLHLVARLDQSCRHDRGGNAFCVIKTAKGRCELNLHQAWDRGFGVFESPVNVARSAVDVGSLDITALTDVHRRWADQVYPGPKAGFSSEAYQSQARKITEDTVSRAISHQTLLLKYLLMP